MTLACQGTVGDSSLMPDGGVSAAGKDGISAADKEGGIHDRATEGSDDSAEEPGSVEAIDCAPGNIQAAPSRLRLLSPDQYIQTVRDLTGKAELAPSVGVNNGEIISALQVEKFNLAAEQIVALGAHHSLVPCDIDAAPDAACAQSFAEAFGKLAFRRPLSTDEITWLTGVYSDMSAETELGSASFSELVDALAQIILQSPQHLYLHEVGISDPALPDGVRRLSSYERAGRLSYMLWGSMPDSALMDAAEIGELDTAEGVRSAAARLLEAPRSRDRVRAFGSAFMRMNDTPTHPSVEKIDKNPERFPLDSPELRTALRLDIEMLFERAVFESETGFRDLFLSRDAFLNEQSAAVYGVPAPKADGFGWTTLPQAERAGLLTRAGFLLSQANADYQSPILRGTFVYRNVLCQTIPDPPPDADDTPPAPEPGDKPQSVRDLTQAKTSEGTCANCHNIINPIGFAFGAYDALGQWQTEELSGEPGEEVSVPVRTDVELSSGVLQGLVSGAVELSELVAESAEAHDCMTDLWFERALARPEVPADRCVLERLRTEFRETGNLRELLLDIASSDAALYVSEPKQ